MTMVSPYLRRTKANANWTKAWAAARHMERAAPAQIALALKNNKSSLTLKERQVLGAAIARLHREGMEHDFYKEGGQRAMIVLILTFRIQQSRRRWKTVKLDEGVSIWIIRRLSTLLFDRLYQGICDFLDKQDPCDYIPVRYLGQYFPLEDGSPLIQASRVQEDISIPEALLVQEDIPISEASQLQEDNLPSDDWWLQPLPENFSLSDDWWLQPLPEDFSLLEDYSLLENYPLPAALQLASIQVTLVQDTDTSMKGTDVSIQDTEASIQDTDASMNATDNLSGKAIASPPHEFLLPLLYAMGSGVPRLIVQRAVSPQIRWGKSGEVEDITPDVAGLDRDLVGFISQHGRWMESFGDLVSQSTAPHVPEADYKIDITLSKSAVVLYAQKEAYWTQRAIELCCFVFPRDQLLESSFDSIGHALLPILRHLLRQSHAKGFGIPSSRNTVEALIAASKFGMISQRRFLLGIAANLYKQVDADVQASYVYAKSVLLRNDARVLESQHVIQEFFNLPAAPEMDPRLHSQLGLLHISQAENWAYLASYQNVYNEAQRWLLPNNPSTMQLYVIRTKLKVLALAYNGEGAFEDAKSALKGCFGAMKPGDDERFLTKAHYADVCCEAMYSRCGTFPVTESTYLIEAEKQLTPEIENLRASAPGSRHLRRLIVSQLEIEILRGRTGSARSLMSEILNTYDAIEEPDMTDQLEHIRVLVAYAGLTPPPDSITALQMALNRYKRYNPYEEDSFACGVIYLFLTLENHKLGNEGEYSSCFAHAARILRNKKPQFLIPGLGTYFYDLAQKDIETAMGWRLPTPG